MQTVATSEANIWSKIIEPQNNGLPPAAARAILKLRFSKQEMAHMTELAQKNQEGLLGDAERAELEAYVKVGDVLSLLHLKARKSLRK